jgi:hypothetical protein
MKITKRQLSLIIENFINEQDWLGDDEDDLLPTKNEKINKSLTRAIEEVSAELLGSNYESQGITKRLADYIVKILKSNIQLHINEDISDQTAGVKAMVYHVDFSYDENNNPTMNPDPIPSWLKIPPKMKQKFESDSARNPIIVVNSANVREDQIETVLLHEVGHIKNGLIKSVSKTAEVGPGEKLNVEVVQSVLRTDLIGKDAEEVLQILVKEKRIKETRSGYDELVKRLNMYYQGVQNNPPDVLGVEEFSVRISAIKRQPSAVDDFKSGKRDYEYFKNEYNSDIADLTLFLDENVDIVNIDKIVKADNLTKSVTV